MTFLAKPIFWLLTVVVSWLGMQAVHESGHILAALATGGRIENVALHPLGISRTDLAANPQPLIVCWAGPVLGCVFPLLTWLLARRRRFGFLLRFFAGFCLLANGLYIGFGSLDGVGDAGDLQRLGAPIWTLWLFGLATAPPGLWLWNGLGKSFGLGRAVEKIDNRNLRDVAVVAVTLIAIGFAIGN
jgi:hypothetical protein